MTKVARYMVTPADKNSPEGFAYYLYQIHVHQSMAVRAETEHYRRAMSSINGQGEGLTMGALYWQTNEIWQGASWASLGKSIFWLTDL
jgi:beta-mannosidase